MRVDKKCRSLALVAILALNNVIFFRRDKPNGLVPDLDRVPPINTLKVVLEQTDPLQFAYHYCSLSGYEIKGR